MNRPIVIGFLVALVIVVITALSSMFVVDQREQALVVQFGEPKRVITEPGLDFKIPFIQKVIYFDKRVLNFDAAAQEAPPSTRSRSSSNPTRSTASSTR